jgi:hypothetical protein
MLRMWRFCTPLKRHIRNIPHQTRDSQVAETATTTLLWRIPKSGTTESGQTKILSPGLALQSTGTSSAALTVDS